MKRLCTIELESGQLDYLLDIGQRSNAYLNIRDGVVTVRLPLSGKPADAERLIRSHEKWIREKLGTHTERSRLPKSFENGEGFSLLGKKYTLRIEESPEYREPELGEDALTVYIAGTMTRADAQRIFSRYVCSICEQRVMQAFETYSARLGLRPKKVTFKYMTSRWGSCSSNGSISINIGVVCFEQECIDYVVIHELCHLKYMDHSDRFWALVSTCCPDYKRMRERMKH